MGEENGSNSGIGGLDGTPKTETGSKVGRRPPRTILPPVYYRDGTSFVRLPKDKVSSIFGLIKDIG